MRKSANQECLSKQKKDFSIWAEEKPWQFGYSEVVRTEQEKKKEPGHTLRQLGGLEKGKYSGFDEQLYSRSVTDRPLVLPP